MQAIILAPILLPFLTAVGCLLLFKNKEWQKIISMAGSIILFAASVYLFFMVEEHRILIVQSGGWQAPFGISVVADIFSAMMVGITSLMGLMVNIYALQDMDKARNRFGFFALFHFLLMGVNGAFLAGDIFNLYVWFEVMLISSFVLLTLGGTRDQLVGGVKYMLLNFIASTFLLAGTGMIYGITGSLNMADVALFFREHPENPLITVAAVFFMIPFALKSAMFPVFFWLPSSYHTPPISTSAIFAGLLTKVGVYSLIRFFTLIFVNDVSYTHSILLAGAGFTMITGVLGAVAMNQMRRILSFHIISQIGYMVMGLALFTPLALAGAIFYIIHHIIVKTNLFLISGVVEKIKGSSELEYIGGLYKSFPLLSLLFLIPALSLAGLPPLSGFWSKFILIKAGFEIQEYTIVVVAIITGLLTLFSMTKIWNFAFWKSDPSTQNDRIFSEPVLFKSHWQMLTPIIVLALCTIFIGLFSGPLMHYSTLAAEQLMNPDEYINAVLTQPEFQPDE
ncbi:MAG: Na+/H+ antiporter subunit D [Bacteroidia bacterium]